MNAAEAAMAGIFGSKGSGGGNVSGVKGDAEETYRTGNVNITAANVGAYTKTETDTLLNSKADTTDVDNEEISSTATNTSITLTDSADARVQGLTVYGRSKVVDGAIKSVGDAGWGVVDLGTLTWTYESTYRFFYSDVLNTNTRTKALCARYNFLPETSAPADMPTGSFTIFTNYRMYVKDTSFTDATAFKSAMSGVLLYYPLADTTGATPTFGITSKNGAGQGTAATITTGLPLRSTTDGTVYDELTNEKVITRCEVVNNEVVPLATPVETPLTSAEKSALASLRTYDHTTHIDATDAPTMTVDYLLNTNNGKAVAGVDNKIVAIKSVSRTGTGTTTNTITFPEVPTYILGIVCNETITTDSITWPFPYGVPCCFVVYGIRSNYNDSHIYHANLTYSADELSLTLTGVDPGAAQNINGYSYTIYYI